MFKVFLVISHMYYGNIIISRIICVDSGTNLVDKLLAANYICGVDEEL